MSDPTEWGATLVEGISSPSANDPTAWGAKPLDAPKSNKPDVGRLNALGKGIESGVTLNWGDELASMGKAATAGTPIEGAPLPGGFAIGFGRYLAEKVKGEDGPATQAFNQEIERRRGEMATAKEQYPGTVLTGEIAGAIAAPIPGMTAVRGAGLGANALRSAVVGSGAGALAGAGEGTDLASRATGAATGGAFGLAGGAAAPYVLRGVEKAGGALSKVAEPFINTLRGPAGIEREAGRRVAGAIDADQRLGQGMGDIEFNAAKGQGAPVTNIERGGTVTGELARSASNTSTEAQTSLKSLADTRFAGQTERAADLVEKLVPGSKYTTAEVKEGLKALAAKANKPAYNSFYRATDNGLWSPELERLAGSPDVLAAMKSAAEKGKNRAIADGYGAFNPGVKFEGDQLIFTRGKQGTPQSPTGQFWDYTYRELRDSADEAFRKGRGSDGNTLKTLANKLKDEIDGAATSQGQSLYKTARAGAARFFDAEDALEAGEKFVSNSMSARDGARAFAQLSTTERELFRHGFASKLLDDIGRTRDGVNVLNKIAATPEAKTKLQIALGPQGYKNVESWVTTETVIDKLRGALGNSTTARQLYNLGLAGGVGIGSVGSYNLDPTTVAGSVALGLLSQRGKKIDERIARRVAEMLVSDDPRVIARGVKMVANSGPLRDAFRSLDRTIGRLAGQQAGGSELFQAGAIGRAEENQPNVPRPPTQ